MIEKVMVYLNIFLLLSRRRRNTSHLLKVLCRDVLITEPLAAVWNDAYIHGYKKNKLKPLEHWVGNCLSIRNERMNLPVNNTWLIHTAIGLHSLHLVPSEVERIALIQHGNISSNVIASDCHSVPLDVLPNSM